MTGIYKIINPKGKIYIGCTINWDRRKKEYSRIYNSKGQTKLYNSFQKYGIENHSFEMIEECSEEYLSEKEIYWILFYDSVNKGLNIRIGNRNGSLTDQTKLKIGESLKGRKNTWSTSEKNGDKISKRLKEYYQHPENKEKISKGLKEYYKNNTHKPKPKLVPEPIVKEIREKFATGDYSKSDLSREYNISWGTVKNIIDCINSYKIV